MIVNMGPHHPSMHGVLRLIVTLDGEDVIDCEPVLGYLHRGMEKIAENRTIIQYLPYVTRWDYLATMFTEAITVNAPERLESVQVPKRASYIRIIMLELSRIASHLLWLGPFMADIGSQTPFFYIFRERELLYDLFEAATGIVEYQKLITRNPIFLERVEGVGFIGGEEAINWGLSGPMLRASGIQWDLPGTKDQLYGVYTTILYVLPYRGSIKNQWTVRNTKSTPSSEKEEQEQKK
ncbi:hypothetical protein TEA_025509 [Camellia sinensis var. sinensis]|uniref:NADH-quinone oxidoreductase subunit D domain-containing protein n=1 Tax=Camellia sinensis var. sinensis TaxID=542762 RepID=A0A4S4D054_CAMSN|nr:hypothetical protein TEA_025509 [Camellia sinensis var. sinensis]